jgi:hypothetical protein
MCANFQLATMRSIPDQATQGPAGAAGGVAFREVMAGWFAIGARDTHEGAQRGRADGTRLAMRVAIHIPDVPSFIRDPEHRAELGGTVAHASLGGTVASTAGVFRLFSPPPAAPHDTGPGVRMVYELGLMHDGAPHWLTGYKTVTGRAPWRLWPETTTLFTTLHRGGDASGPVVGAGILQLGPLDFGAMLTTMRPAGGGGIGTIAHFGAFFAGQLVRRYFRIGGLATTRPIAP